MRVGEEQEMTIADFFDLCEQGGTYQIDTPYGWKDIPCLLKKRDKESYNLIFENGIKLGCSADHYVLTVKNDQYNWVKAEDLDVNGDDLICFRNDYSRLVAKEYIGARDTFDLEVDDESHSYYSNNVISHNTGKSATCDALADLYQMPLLRLDFGAIFASHVGESEARIREALSVADAVAPCVLWVDEIEKGIGGVESSNSTDGGVTNRVFGTMLTWMQDKQSLVFVVCTANNVTGIPPEFMRAGRFDEIFFIDLPDDGQREEVIEKLLTRKNRNPSDFNIDKIVSASQNYTPVEIEKGIDNGLFVAYSQNKRNVTTEDIVKSLSSFHPLYNSRREDIQRMRQWALGENGLGGRAVLANSRNKSDSANHQEIEDTGRMLDLDI